MNKAMLRVVDLKAPPEDFLIDEAEGFAFHKAFQTSRIASFTCGYLAIYRNDDRIAVAPYFVHDFRLNTMLSDGLLKACVAWIRLRIACVGHPSSDVGIIEGEASAETLAAINRELVQKSSLVAYKGFDGNLPLPGFVKARGLPVPTLKIHGDYYSTLSSRRRNDFKRKLKRADGLTFEEYDGLPDHLSEKIHGLYLQTHDKATIKFERLTLDYFLKTGPISKYLVFYDEHEPIGFAQLLCKNKKMVHKYVGMNYDKNRQYGLYFLLFLRAIDICVRDGYSEFESGATAYNFKQLLGSTLTETYVYYKHSSPAANWLLRKLCFLLEPSEEELR